MHAYMAVISGRLRGARWTEGIKETKKVEVAVLSTCSENGCIPNPRRRVILKSLRTRLTVYQVAIVLLLRWGVSYTF